MVNSEKFTLTSKAIIELPAAYTSFLVRSIKIIMASLVNEFLKANFHY